MFVLPVSRVCSLLRESIESDPRFNDVYISGEISNLMRSSAGHIYFTLKDAAGQLRCAFFRRANARTGALLENGAHVVAHGSISVYEQRGELQCIVDFVHQEGMGILHLEFERLKEKLFEEGLFDEERKRPLPDYPRRIGVVTSPDGAVFHDVCHVLRRRWPLVEVVLAPTLVQGDGACEGVCAAIADLNRIPGVDLIIVCRGGGSMEDLWTFNMEPVARAIFASRAPVISAVGHETDYTIADFVADLRAPTPSAAAEVAVPNRIEIALRTGALADALGGALRRRVQDARWDLDGAIGSLLRAAPDIAGRRQRVSVAVERAGDAIRRGLNRRHGDIGERYLQLNALSPLNTIARGYALVRRTADGRAVVSWDGVQPGDGIAVTVYGGEIRAEVTGLAERNGHKRGSRNDE
jgi:exodeoxyribonuclease VII large subunit